ncbi:MAG: hypothetical protein Q8R98_27460 [Rubrivivax sp.]|nr:hypothetical protein [Rubrivivax sp.]
MSVPVQTPYKKYTAAPGATVFPTTFRVVLAGDLQVRVDTVVVTSGFSLSALGAPSGLDVTFTAPMVGGEVVELQRIIPKSRVNDYQQLGDFNAATVNADIDRTWMSIQEMGEELDRAVKVPIGSAIDPDQLIEDLLAVQVAANASAVDAAAAEVASEAFAAAAAASAASTNLPALTGKTLQLLRVKSDESGYETRTPAQTLTDIGAHGLQMIHVRDEKSSGSVGGASSTGNQVRELNTVVVNTIVGASLGSNQISLPAGNYRVLQGSAPCVSGGRLRLKLVTGSTVLALGIPEYTVAAGTTMTVAHVGGRFSLASISSVALNHHIETSRASDGLGLAITDGEVEVFASLVIVKE